MIRYRYTLVVVLVLTAGSRGSAQVGHDTNLWCWTDSAAHHRSIVRVSLNGSEGTGAIVYKDPDQSSAAGMPGICATALHVVESSRTGGSVRISFFNGQTVENCQIIQADESVDLALIQLTVPHEVPASRPSASVTKNGDAIEIVGLGGGSQLARLRSFSTKASAPTNETQIFADVTLLPGDSGGAVFDPEGQVVGIVSGGWFWFDAGIRTTEGQFVQATWPARASNATALRTLLEKAIEQGLAAPNPVQIASHAEEASTLPIVHTQR